jgi:hypothetical protein
MGYLDHSTHQNRHHSNHPTVSCRTGPTPQGTTPLTQLADSRYRHNCNTPELDGRLPAAAVCACAHCRPHVSFHSALRNTVGDMTSTRHACNNSSPEVLIVIPADPTALHCRGLPASKPQGLVLPDDKCFHVRVLVPCYKVPMHNCTSHASKPMHSTVICALAMSLDTASALTA